MQKVIEQLSDIGALISKDVSLAEKELKAFCQKHKNTTNAYVNARVFLLQMTIAVIRDTYKPDVANEKKALNYFIKNELYDDAANLLLTKTRHFFVRGQLGPAEELLHIIQQEYLDKISIKPEIVYLTRMSFLHMRKQDTTEQVNISLKALEKLKQLKEKDVWHNNNYTIFACNIANVYIEIHQFEAALPYLNASNNLIENAEVALYNQWNVFHYFSHYYSCQNDWTKAFEWTEKQIALLENDNEYTNLLNLSYVNAAQNCYLIIRDCKPDKKQRAYYLNKQREYVNGSLKLKGDEKSSNGAYILIAMARVEYQSGNYEIAADYIERFIVYNKKNKQKLMEWQCFSEAHYIYLAWGKQTNDSTKLIKAYEYLLAERNITEQQSRINHKEKLDAVTNKYELKQKALSEKLAQQEIDALKTEVQSISFNLNEKIQVLDEIKMYVNSLKKKEHEARQLLNTIARKINSVKITEEEKATLQFKISEVNQQITKILSEKYPALSTMEIRMCGLFQSGITNKELAKMYGQSEKSYEQHRYRIKKKMGLGAKDNLVKHLTALYLTAK